MSELRDRILDELEQTGVVRWTPLEALCDHEAMTCIDGRQAGYRVGAPGGDMGELVVLLAGLEEVRGQALDAEAIDRALGTVIDAHGTFYMHTDAAAVDALRDQLAGEEGGAVPDDDRLVTGPAEALQDRLLELLGTATYTGCGHLKQMLERPGDYAVRRALVSQAIEAFYRRLWAGDDRLRLDVLPGTHEELAVVAIDVDGDDDADLYVPAVQLGEGTQLFIDHPAAREAIRRRRLDLLVDAGIAPADKVDAIAKAADALGDRHAEATVTALAADLPRVAIRLAPHRDAT